MSDSHTNQGGERREVMHIDLTGSRLGPEWLSCEVVVTRPDGWTDEQLRRSAADYYAVPLNQVTDPWLAPSGEVPDARS